MVPLKNYKLVIIGHLKYPSSDAPSNRTHAYAKGLAEIGHNVLVICTGTPFTFQPDIPVSGTYEGVHYIYPIGQVKNRFLFIRKFKSAISPFVAVYFLKKLTKSSSGFVLLEFCTSFLQEIIYRIYCWFNQIPVLREANEIPGYNKKQNSFSLKVELFLHKKFRTRLWDGVIVISGLLQKFYLQSGNISHSGLKMIKIPVLVDNTRFENKKNDLQIKGPYIAYVGNMNDVKDGIGDLIKAFKLAFKNLPDHRLVLAGPVSPGKKQEFMKIAGFPHIRDRIVFTGLIDKKEVVDIISSASILALARRRTRQNDAGFPTKLGEYLATGNPVVVSRTGEIPGFLKDGVHAYLAEPGNPEDFAGKLSMAAINKKLARQIGENGRGLAETTFNYKNHSDRLNDFLSSLLKIPDNQSG